MCSFPPTLQNCLFSIFYYIISLEKLYFLEIVLKYLEIFPAKMWSNPFEIFQSNVKVYATGQLLKV